MSKTTTILTATSSGDVGITPETLKLTQGVLGY